MPVNLTHADAALRVCIDCVEEGRVSGRVLSRRLTAPLVFCDIGSFLLQLEAVLDAQQLPQAFQRTRSFSADLPAPISAAARTLEEGMSLAAVEAAVGAISTFTLHIFTRRNTTWQGKIDWLDGTGLSQTFSSVLELIKRTDQHMFGAS